MTRVKKGVNALKTRRNILKQAKGFRFGRSTKEKLAYEQLSHSYASAFAHRKDKKNDARKAWNVRINGPLRAEGISYSKFIGAMKKGKVEIDRKILATLALEYPVVFKKIVAKVK